jgi:GTP-binding nuclear protein Ran
MLTFKIVLVGDGGCGKTSYIKQLRKQEFDGKYIATQGVDVCPLTFNSNYGPIVFKVWDCAGQDKFCGLKDGYYINAQAAIVTFDLTNQLGLQKLNQWVLSVYRVTGDVPCVICGTKSDLRPRVSDSQIHSYINGCIPYYQTSANQNTNLENPFLYLARKLTKNADLVFYA